MNDWDVICREDRGGIYAGKGCLDAKPAAGRQLGLHSRQESMSRVNEGNSSRVELRVSSGCRESRPDLGGLGFEFLFCVLDGSSSLCSTFASSIREPILSKAFITYPFSRGGHM